eukprot:2613251-Amphidinium_carterae.8
MPMPLESESSDRYTDFKLRRKEWKHNIILLPKQRTTDHAVHTTLHMDDHTQEDTPNEKARAKANANQKDHRTTTINNNHKKKERDQQKEKAKVRTLSVTIVADQVTHPTNVDGNVLLTTCI